MRSLSTMRGLTRPLSLLTCCLISFSPYLAPSCCAMTVSSSTSTRTLQYTSVAIDSSKSTGTVLELVMMAMRVASRSHMSWSVSMTEMRLRAVQEAFDLDAC